jgi:ketosteroid isomerase-like protein
LADEHPNARLVREFHEAQNRFYAGAEQASVVALLAEDVVWHVPGASPLAGEHRGLREVLAHFARRRELARGSFRIDVRGVLADDQRTVILAGGEVRRGDEVSTWGTIGIFRVADGRIAECWVLPHDQRSFDEIWSSLG